MAQPNAAHMLDERGYVYDLGQFDLAQTRWLQNAARRGDLLTARVPWPSLTWHLRLKRVYVLPGASVPFYIARAVNP